MFKKTKILLIEDDVSMRMDFHDCIKAYPDYEIYKETGSESYALHVLNTHTVDIIILDLELEEGDGLNFAAEMRKLPIVQPFIVVTTNNPSISVHQYLHNEIRVDFIYQKSNVGYSPKQVLEIIEKVYKYHNKQASTTSVHAKQIIEQELKNLGFRDNLLGSSYLAYLLFYLSEHKHSHSKLSKELYPMVAKHFSTDASNVEKAIRTAIEVVWKKTGTTVLTKYYPYPINSDSGRPSNGELIKNLSRKLFGV